MRKASSSSESASCEKEKRGRKRQGACRHHCHQPLPRCWDDLPRWCSWAQEIRLTAGSEIYSGETIIVAGDKWSNANNAKVLCQNRRLLLWHTACRRCRYRWMRRSTIKTSGVLWAAHKYGNNRVYEAFYSIKCTIICVGQSVDGFKVYPTKLFNAFDWIPKET